MAAAPLVSKANRAGSRRGTCLISDYPELCRLAKNWREAHLAWHTDYKIIWLHVAPTRYRGAIKWKLAKTFVIVATIAFTIAVTIAVGSKLGIAQSLSPSVVADYARQYKGLGFDDEDIRMFAEVQLPAKDFRALRRRWRAIEIAMGAFHARVFGLKGKKGVSSLIGASEEEVELWRKYQRAKTDDERERIFKQIEKMPPHGSR